MSNLCWTIWSPLHLGELLRGLTKLCRFLYSNIIFLRYSDNFHSCCYNIPHPVSLRFVLRVWFWAIRSICIYHIKFHIQSYGSHVGCIPYNAYLQGNNYLLLDFGPSNQKAIKRIWKKEIKKRIEIIRRLETTKRNRICKNTTLRFKL